MTENQNKSINIFIVFLGVTAIVFVFNHLIYVLFFGGSFFPSINPINLIAKSNLLALPLNIFSLNIGIIPYWMNIGGLPGWTTWQMVLYMFYDVYLFLIIPMFILWIIGPVLNFIIAFIIKKVIWK